MKARSLVKLGLLMVLVLAAPWVCAQDGLQGALPRANLASTLTRPFQQTLALADFDGDDKPDGAVLIDSGRLQPNSSLRTIELHFTGRANTNLTFETDQTGLAISALDVNRDGAADIVVEQPFTHKRIQVWLNDGRGGFHEARTEDYAAVDQGTGEQVEAPSQHPDPPALCLPPQRGYEIAILTACGSPDGRSSSGERALDSSSQVISIALATISTRAPPFTLPL